MVKIEKGEKRKNEESNHLKGIKVKDGRNGGKRRNTEKVRVKKQKGHEKTERGRGKRLGRERPREKVGKRKADRKSGKKGTERKSGKRKRQREKIP